MSMHFAITSFMSSIKGIQSLSIGDIETYSASIIDNTAASIQSLDAQVTGHPT